FSHVGFFYTVDLPLFGERSKGIAIQAVSSSELQIVSENVFCFAKLLETTTMLVPASGLTGIRFGGGIHGERQSKAASLQEDTHCSWFGHCARCSYGCPLHFRRCARAGRAAAHFFLSGRPRQAGRPCELADCRVPSRLGPQGLGRGIRVRL